MGAADRLSARAAAHPGWLVANLVMQLAFGLLAMTVCLPSMQEWPAQFGASQAAVQLTFSAFVATYGTMQLVYGSLSDRIGRKPVLVAGLLLAIAGSVAGALSRDLAMLTAARALQGAGCAAGMVIARAMVQDLFDGSERTRVMALIGMSMGVCPPLATVLGGQMHVRLGWQANFVAMAVLGAVLLLAAWFGLPAGRHGDTARVAARSPLAGYLRLAREPSFWLSVGLLATLTATFYSFLAGLPLVLAAYGVTPATLGWYIGVVPLAYIGGNYLTTRLARTHSDRFIMGWGQAATIAGLLLVLALALAGVRSPLAVVLPLLLLGVGHGLVVPPTLTGTVGVVPALAGSAAAVGGVSQQVLGAVGAFAVGLVPHQGAVNLAALMLAWTLVGLGLQLALQSRRARANKPAAPAQSLSASGTHAAMGTGASINYFVWCAMGALFGWCFGLVAGSKGQSTLIENLLVGVFGAFVAGDVFTAVISGVKSDGAFQVAALLPAAAGAGIALALVSLMRRAVGPMKNSKAKPVRR